MKLPIRISLFSFLFMAASSWANPIYLFHENTRDEALIYRNLLIDQYKIPENLISIRQVYTCEDIGAGGKFELCLKKNGDLVKISVDKEFINQSLKVFQLP